LVRLAAVSACRCFSALCRFRFFIEKMLYFILMKEIQTYQSLLDHIQQKDAISGIAQPPSCGSVPNCIV